MGGPEPAEHAERKIRAAASPFRIDVIMRVGPALASCLMSMRVVLRSPSGATVVRGVADGLWAEAPSAPEFALGEGLWALPGLVDGHSHLAGDGMPHLASPTSIEAAATRAEEALAAGVTLVYDKGWSDETALDLIDHLPPSRRPQIEAAGRMIASEGGYYAGFATEIEPADIEDQVSDAVGGRARWVKLIGDWPRAGVGPKANFSADELERAVAAARLAGARVAIHTMARDVPSMAVAAGVDSIEHGLFLHEGDLDVLAGVGGMWVPTIRQVEATAASLRPGSSGQSLLVEGIANACRLLPLAVEAGVVVLAGTDMAVPTAEVAAEAIRISECGIEPASVLQIIAGHGHESAGRSVTFELGTTADAVLYRENPMEDLGVLMHPTHVIREGRLVG